MKEKRPTIKATILGYEKKSQKSGDYQKRKQKNNKTPWKEKFQSIAVCPQTKQTKQKGWKKT